MVLTPSYLFPPTSTECRLTLQGLTLFLHLKIALDLLLYRLSLVSIKYLFIF